jgi:uncharacterized protein
VQAIREDHQFVVRLDVGEELFESLTKLARSEQLRAGVIEMGIGMLNPVRIGYWNGREYAPRDLNVPHELVALHGTLAEADGIPSLHLHAALAGPDHAVVGGHLMMGRVSVLAEIHLVTYPARRFARPIDESLGLRRIDLCPGPAGPG